MAINERQRAIVNRRGSLVHMIRLGQETEACCAKNPCGGSGGSASIEDYSHRLDRSPLMMAVSRPLESRMIGSQNSSSLMFRSAMPPLSIQSTKNVDSLFLDRFGEPNTHELPSRPGGKEVPISGPDMGGRSGARPTAQYKLVSHEFTVIFPDCP